jgi:hypothetical protein
MSGWRLSFDGSANHNGVTLSVQAWGWWRTHSCVQCSHSCEHDFNGAKRHHEW